MLILLAAIAKQVSIILKQQGYVFCNFSLLAS